MGINKCIDCGRERNYKSKVGRCQTCRDIFITAQNRINARTNLASLGFELVEDSDCRSHSIVTVKNLKCGHTFSARTNNLITGRTKCGICGPKERMKKCMAGYMKNNARDYDNKKWTDYRDYVRRLSDRIYKENISKINPEGLMRNRYDNHLDHKVPLIVCFKEGVDAKVAGSLLNLQMSSARDNLSKNKHSYDKKVLRKLLLESIT